MDYHTGVILPLWGIVGIVVAIALVLLVIWALRDPDFRRESTLRDEMDERNQWLLLFGLAWRGLRRWFWRL